MSKKSSGSGGQPVGACLRCPDGLDLPALQRGLAAAYQLRAADPERQSFIFHDTFDWRLWFAGRLLCQTGESVELVARGPGWPGAAAARQQLGPVWSRLAGEWPPGPVRDAVAPLAGPRALLPVAEIMAVEQAVEVLDRDHRVVFRCDLSEWSLSGNPAVPFCRLCRPRPLSEYPRAAAAVSRQLRALGLVEDVRGPVAEALDRLGRAPAPYTLRPAFGLAPADPAREAVRKIVPRMLALARSQESGIAADLDREFLHDYRICLRKVRSILTLLKDVYPPRETARLKRICGTLTRATNSLRDLDVLLLDHGVRRESLPEGLRGGLDPLLESLQAARRAEHERVRRYLESAAYRRRIEGLIAFFTQPDQLPVSPNSAAPILPLVSRRIFRRYRRILRESRAIHRRSPDSAMHAIRIQGKKLRYLLEFFGELFDPGELDGLLRRLRQLQYRLGRFNDCAVQQKSLLRYWQDLPPSTAAASALAVGGMVALLHHQQQRQRRRAEKALARFRAPKIRRRVRAVFKSRPARTASPV